VKIKFDACITTQPSMMDKVEKNDTMVLPIEQDNDVSFIPPIDFIIPCAFNNGGLPCS
jgi:hypothetical protein